MTEGSKVVTLLLLVGGFGVSIAGAVRGSGGCMIRGSHLGRSWSSVQLLAARQWLGRVHLLRRSAVQGSQGQGSVEECRGLVRQLT